MRKRNTSERPWATRRGFAFRAWVVCDPAGRPLLTTIGRTRDAAMRAYAHALTLRVLGAAVTWRAAYRRGFRLRVVTAEVRRG